MENKNIIENNKKSENKLDSRGNEAFKEIKARNRYTYETSRYSIILATLHTFLLIIYLSSFTFFMNQNVPPNYIPTDNEMRYFPPVPLSKFEKSDADIQTFVMETLTDLFAYDYINYNQQLNKSQDRFTGDGWVNFVTSMQKSFTLVSVKNNQYISSYKTLSLPKIIKKDVKDGVAFWYVETEGIINYRGTSQEKSDRVNIKMKIERVSTLNKETGIGISSFIFNIHGGDVK